MSHRQDQLARLSSISALRRQQDEGRVAVAMSKVDRAQRRRDMVDALIQRVKIASDTDDTSTGMRLRQDFTQAMHGQRIEIEREIAAARAALESARDQLRHSFGACQAIGKLEDKLRKRNDQSSDGSDWPSQ